MNKSKKQKQPNLMLILIVILVFLVVVTVFFKMDNKKDNNVLGENQNVSVDYQKVLENENQEELKKIKGMNERTRIEYYVSNYIKLLEEEKYDTAYGLLNKEYKKNFFKTQNEFAEYCENNFPRMADVSYNNFERNGEIYVLWITIADAINGSKESAKQINFVIKENNFNDYELSFSKN